MEARTAGTAPYSLQMPEWLVFLLTLCGVAEGVFVGAIQPPEAVVSAQCVVAVLNDPQRRVAILGGREGMPRSLASVYGGSIARFLGGFRGGFSRIIATPNVNSTCNGVAVSRDGSALLVSDYTGDIHAIHIFPVHTRAHVQTIGGLGRGPLQFWPHQVWVAPDGFVFVADFDNNRVKVLTPWFYFHSFVGVGQLCSPVGVCADNDVIVVSECYIYRVSVFNRTDGTLMYRFGEGQLRYPAGVCFMSDHRHVAVADYNNDRVSVWTLEGKFVRYEGEGKVKSPLSVACSDANELIVAERHNNRVVVFSASGEIVWTSEASAGSWNFTGVTMHGSTIFAQAGSGKCVVFT